MKFSHTYNIFDKTIGPNLIHTQYELFDQCSLITIYHFINSGIYFHISLEPSLQESVSCLIVSSTSTITFFVGKISYRVRKKFDI